MFVLICAGELDLLDFLDFLDAVYSASYTF